MSADTVEDSARLTDAERAEILLALTPDVGPILRGRLLEFFGDAQTVAASRLPLDGAKVADAESQKGATVPPTAGAIYQPIDAGATVEGGIRERMQREDDARRAS